jgi:hypothetical protein
LLEPLGGMLHISDGYLHSGASFSSDTLVLLKESEIRNGQIPVGLLQEKLDWTNEREKRAFVFDLLHDISAYLITERRYIQRDGVDRSGRQHLFPKRLLFKYRE